MGLVFGIISIVVGFFAAWIAGWAGFITVAILAILAVVFTILKNKKLGEDEKKKKGGIITGIIGLVLGFLMMLAVMGIGDKMKKDINANDYPILSQVCDSFSTGGVMGMVSKVQDLGLSTDDLQKELDKWSSSITK